MATLGQLMANTFPVFLDPVPKKTTVKAWLDTARIPRFKANPAAIRGGGDVYYSVAAVEKFLASRTSGGPAR